MVVVAAWRSLQNGERFAAIRGAIDRDVGQVDSVGIVGIDRDAAEIPGAAVDAWVVRNLRPGLARIVGAEEPGCGNVVDERVDAPALSSSSNGHSGTPPSACGQTMAGDL